MTDVNTYLDPAREVEDFSSQKTQAGADEAS